MLDIRSFFLWFVFGCRPTMTIGGRVGCCPRLGRSFVSHKRVHSCRSQVNSGHGKRRYCDGKDQATIYHRRKMGFASILPSATIIHMIV